MSYNPGNFYGNDQIVFDPSDSRDLLNFNSEKPIIDSNSMSDINNIKNMETRLLKKINNIRPSCNQNPHCVQYPNDPNYLNSKVNLFSPEGAYIEQNRMDIRKNIEDYYFGDRYYKPSDGCANRPPRDCSNPQSEHFFNQTGGNMHGIDDMYDNRINYSNKNGDNVIRKNKKKQKIKENMYSKNNGCISQCINFLDEVLSFDNINNNIIYLFLLFCVFIIISQNNNIIHLNKIIANTSKKNTEVNTGESAE